MCTIFVSEYKKNGLSYCRAICVLELLILIERDILFVPGRDFSAGDTDVVTQSVV